MTRAHTYSWNRKPVVGAALVGLSLTILFGKLDGTVAGLITSPLGTAAREALELLPNFVPAAWQALQVDALDHQWLSWCAPQMLVSLWPLLHAVSGAV